MTTLDRRRARSSYPRAELRFVAELATVVALELLATDCSPVPSFMATVASAVKPSRRRETGLQSWRSEGHAARAALRLDKHPRRLLLPHAARRIESSSTFLRALHMLRGEFLGNELVDGTRAWRQQGSTHLQSLGGR
jgi:hypothetical protein